MIVLSTDRTLDELQDLAEQHGFPRNVVKPISMIVYDIPDDAFHGVKQRKTRSAKVRGGSGQGGTDGNQE